MRLRLDTYCLQKPYLIPALLTALLAALALLPGTGGALAQTGGNRITFVKEATPADGANFSLGAPLRVLGSFGSEGDNAEGQFDEPEAIAVGPDGLLTVADRENHRIQQFDAAGNFVRMWGWDVIPGGDTGFEICTSGCKTGAVGGGAGQLDDPVGVAVGPDGSIYIGDSDNERIDHFDAGGNFVRAWGWDVIPGGDTGFEICTTTCKKGAFGGGAGQFNSPFGVAVGPDGSLYVADAGNYRIQQFTPAGEFARAWGWGVATGAMAFEVCTGPCLTGLSGGGAGQFMDPFGVAVGEDGSVYVADDEANRIQQFTAAGEFVRTWGWGVATGTEQFEICTSLCQAGIAGAAAGQLNLPYYVTIGSDADGSTAIYVTNYGTERVMQFDVTGNFVRAWGWGVRTGAASFEVCTGVCQSGSTGSGAGQFDGPNGIVAANDGTIYVTDYHAARVQRFLSGSLPFDDAAIDDGDAYTDTVVLSGLPDGTYVFSETMPSTLWSLKNVTCTGIPDVVHSSSAFTVTLSSTNTTCTLENVGPAALTLVKEAEPATGTDFALATTLTPLSAFGSRGSGAGRFNFHEGLAIGPDGSLYVADYANHRIQQLTEAGNFVRAWGWGVATGAEAFEVCTGTCRAGISGGGAGQFDGAADLDVGADGSVYVADRGGHRIQHFEADGDFIRAWGWDVIPGGGTGFEVCTTTCQAGTSGGGAGQFDDPSDVVVALDGSVYVADFNNHRIQHFTATGDFLRTWGWGVDSGASALEVCVANCQAGSQGSGAGQFYNPQALAVGQAGSVYAVDLHNQRIQQFNAVGGFLRTWGWGVDSGANAFEICVAGCQAGSQGSGAGQFNNPGGIAVGPDGQVYVSDYDSHRVQQFDPEGHFMRAWGWGVRTGAAVFEVCTGPCQSGVSGGGLGQFKHPGRITAGPDGTLYVTDKDNQRIQRFLASSIILDDSPQPDGDRFGNTVVLAALPPATFLFTETVPALWTLDEVSCTGNAGTRSGNSFAVTLAPNTHITCTLTNLSMMPTLTVEKVVVGGGPLDADDFSLFVDGNRVSRGVATVLLTGTHTVSETLDARYMAAFGGDCDANGNVTLGERQSRTCVITNTYIGDTPTQTLTVNKVVVGGPLDADDFPLFIDGNRVGRGAANALEPGTYTVSETGSQNYTATFSGACNSSGVVELGSGQYLSCTITNTHTDPDDDPGDDPGEEPGETTLYLPSIGR